MTADSRGPLRRIVEVQAYRQSTHPQIIGGCIPLLLECGHVAEVNFTFTHKVGEQHRCTTCGTLESEAQ